MTSSASRVAIHQPEYFPWLGLLDKARRVDAFVFLDNVQFDRSSLQHRAKVLGANGAAWLTIPFVHRFPQNIDDVRAVDGRWAVKHEKTLRACYGRAPGFAAAMERLVPFFASPTDSLCDTAIASTRILLDAFGVTTPVMRASALAARGEKGDLVLAICKELGARTYVSGRSGATYLDAARFEAAGVHIEVQRFEPRPYPRLRSVSAEDDRGVSALDAWMNLGRAAPSFLGEPADVVARPG